MEESLSVKQQRFAAMLGRLLVFVGSTGRTVKIVDLYRTQAQQAALVAAKKSKTMQSKHTLGLAVDLALFNNLALDETPEDFRPLGEFWEVMAGRWGGRFGVSIIDYHIKVGWDPCHFELAE